MQIPNFDPGERDIECINGFANNAQFVGFVIELSVTRTVHFFHSYLYRLCFYLCLLTTSGSRTLISMFGNGVPIGVFSASETK